MVKRSYTKPLLVLLLVLIAVWMWLRPGTVPEEVPAAGVPVATTGRGAAAPRTTSVPAIGLDRTRAPQEESGAGKRNVFDFYEPPAPPAPKLPPQVVYAPAPTPTPIPPLNIKYVGSAERSGARRAIFLTDQNEVLTGGEGETVANRVKVVRINLESIDVQDLLSGQPRRIPLRGN